MEKSEPFILHTHNSPAKLFGKTIYIPLHFRTSIPPPIRAGGGALSAFKTNFSSKKYDMSIPNSDTSTKEPSLFVEPLC